MGVFVDGGVMTGYAKPPAANAAEGNAVVLTDNVNMSVAGAASDVLRFGPFPAGIVPTLIVFQNADLDSGATTTHKTGYSYTDGTTGDDDYYEAAGQTWLRGAATTLIHAGASLRKEHKREWNLDITLGAAADTAGVVYVTIYGIAVGAA